MAPKPRQSGIPPTTTTPPPVGPSPSTTVPLSPETQAIIAAVQSSLGFGGPGKDILGFEGSGVFQDGRLVQYEGPRKTVGGEQVLPQYFEGD